MKRASACASTAEARPAEDRGAGWAARRRALGPRLAALPLPRTVVALHEDAFILGDRLQHVDQGLKG
jgi:hypothetical protein